MPTNPLHDADCRLQVPSVLRHERQLLPGLEGGLLLSGALTPLRALFLQVPGEAGRSHPASLIAITPGHCMTLEWPTDSDGRLPLRAGDTLELRCLAGREQVYFRASVQGCQLRPRPCIDLDWPRPLERPEKRALRRVTVARAASLQVRDADACALGAIHGELFDMSLKGVGFHAQTAQLQVGMRCTIRLALYPEPQHAGIFIRPESILRSRRPANGSAGGWDYGFEFSALQSNDRLILLAMLGEGMQWQEATGPG